MTSTLTRSSSSNGNGSNGNGTNAKLSPTLVRVPSWVDFADDPFRAEGISLFRNSPSNLDSNSNLGRPSPSTAAPASTSTSIAAPARKATANKNKRPATAAARYKDDVESDTSAKPSRDWLSLGVEGIKSTFARNTTDSLQTQTQTGLPSPPASVKSGVEAQSAAHANVDGTSRQKKVDADSSGEVSTPLPSLPPDAAAPVLFPASSSSNSTSPASQLPSTTATATKKDFTARTLSTFPACGLVRKRTGTAFLLPLRPLQNAQQQPRKKNSFVGLRAVNLPLTPFNPFAELHDSPLGVSPSELAKYRTAQSDALNQEDDGMYDDAVEEPELHELASSASRSSVSDGEVVAGIAATPDQKGIKNELDFDVFNAADRTDDRGCRSETTSLSGLGLNANAHQPIELAPLELAPVEPLVPVRLKSLQQRGARRPISACPPPRPERRRPIRPQSAILPVAVAVATAAAIAGGGGSKFGAGGAAGAGAELDADPAAVAEDLVDQGEEADASSGTETPAEGEYTSADADASRSAATAQARITDIRVAGGAHVQGGRTAGRRQGRDAVTVADTDTDTGSDASGPLASRALKAVLAPAPVRALLAEARTLHLSLPDLGRVPRGGIVSPAAAAPAADLAMTMTNAVASASSPDSPPARVRSVSPPATAEVVSNADAPVSTHGQIEENILGEGQLSENTEGEASNSAVSQSAREANGHAGSRSTEPVAQNPTASSVSAPHKTAKHKKRHSAVKNAITSRIKHLGKRITSL